MKDQELVKALREHAEWARANEWETPITLGDDLAEAAARIEAQAKEIEKLREQLRHLCQNCDLDRLEKLAESDKDGRLVVPCKIGDTVYEIIRYRNFGIVEIVERTVLSVEIFQDDGYIKMQRWVPCHDTGDILKQSVDSWAKIEDFGKTVFLTHEEAEKALEAMKDE